MLSTIDLVVAGLSTGNKIGLAVTGVAFIVFALISSFVLPRRNPNFPGKSMGWYVTLCVVFFLAMITAVLVFGKEKEEVRGESPARTETRSGSLPGQTASTPTTTAPASGGDATAGKAVFATAGCGGCHTLQAAGASGSVGPNLDELKPTEGAVAHQVEVGGGAMPAFKGQLTDEQIADVAAYVASTARSTGQTPAGGGGGGGGGDATAGKAVFASAGCGGCHTLQAAGASGTVGPNLDELKPAEGAVAHQVEVGGGGMPAFKGQLTDKQIADVAAYVASSAGP